MMALKKPQYASLLLCSLVVESPALLARSFLFQPGSISARFRYRNRQPGWHSVEGRSARTASGVQLP
jgi:hypothetical protein